MSYTRETATIGYSAMRTMAQGYVSLNADAPVLVCDACGRQCETFESAHDDAVWAISDFLNHTAFDHAGRASILEFTLTRVVSWTDAAESIAEATDTYVSPEAVGTHAGHDLIYCLMGTCGA